MKRIIWMALALALFAAAAGAQDVPAGDFSVGYSYLRLGGSGGVNQNGGSASIAVNANHWIGFVGDFGAYRASPFGASLTTYTFLFGPRFSHRTGSRTTPFAQVLFGGSHLSAGVAGFSASVSPFDFSFGGGVDFGLSRKAALRTQVDYIGMRSSGSTVNCTRLSVGIVFGFGSK